MISGIAITANSPTLLATKEELEKGLNGLLRKNIPLKNSLQNGVILAARAVQSPVVAQLISKESLTAAGKEGFVIRSVNYQGKNIIIITANNDIGILYGSFHFLRLLQTQQPVSNLKIISSPSLQLRLLNHWDNLNRYVERGYAGISIWNWHTLPGYIDPRYKDYARANASIGINGASITNVNANAMVLTKPYLEKCAALANVFRPYGIKLYLTAQIGRAHV